MARDGMPVPQLKGRPLGRVLIKMGKVTRAQISEALELQKTKRGPLGQLLIELGYVNDRDVHFALAAQAGMESITLTDIDIDKPIVDLIPAQMANTYRLVPTAGTSRYLWTVRPGWCRTKTRKLSLGTESTPNWIRLINKALFEPLGTKYFLCGYSYILSEH